MDLKQNQTRRRFLGEAALAGAAGLLAPGLSSAAEPREGTSAWRIGCYTRPWGAHDYRVALDAIAEAGFKYAGLMTTRSTNGLVISTATTEAEALRIGEECEARGLIPASAYGGDFPVAESLEKGVEGLKRLIDNCAAAKVPNLMLGGTGDSALQEAYYQAVARSCDHAVERGIGISVKPHGGLNATGPQCRELIEKVGRDQFRIWYDPGNILYYSDGVLDPVRDAAVVNGLVVGMSVKDYIHPKVVDVTPGDGKVDFAGVLKQLKAGGFNGGPLIVECLKPGGLPELLAEAKRARLFLEALTA
ncbi:MAG: sugar phosphate isomerase/epimerase [Candidatus Omnitrophica bacterium]|nr:hypothetical protein [bacterium]NUN95727.1 sugar phosphate isomerase/epimerase [Candidatus Omnitrophota bacterium]